MQGRVGERVFIEREPADSSSLRREVTGEKSEAARNGWRTDGPRPTFLNKGETPT